MHPYLKDFYKEEDLISFKGSIVMEADENIKLSTQAYKELISKHFM